MEKNRTKANRAGGTSGFKPVLGLSDEPVEPVARPVLTGTVYDQPEPEELLELTVIVPARNEEDCLGACLQSLVSQSEEIFELGRDWELMVVDDHSTDRTAEIARALCRGHGDRGRQAGAGLDGEDQRHLDGGEAGAGAVAAVYRRGHDPRAGKSAPGACTRRYGTRWAC